MFSSSDPPLILLYKPLDVPRLDLNLSGLSGNDTLQSGQSHKQSCDLTFLAKQRSIAVLFPNKANKVTRACTSSLVCLTQNQRCKIFEEDTMMISDLSYILVWE